jgi:hypothetical protein
MLGSEDISAPASMFIEFQVKQFKEDINFHRGEHGVARALQSTWQGLIQRSGWTE